MLTYHRTSLLTSKAQTLVNTVNTHGVMGKGIAQEFKFRYRQHWPSRLFRHEPLENIVPILGGAELLSRDEALARGGLINDVAPEHIIQANCAAHDSVRLYFRPRTPTQFHIEGIREPADFYSGKHAAVLYMMCFNSVGILTSPGVAARDSSSCRPWHRNDGWPR